MAASLFYSILWATLIAFNLLISLKLFSIYKKDGDLRKIMFTIGLLMCNLIYTVAIIGINSSALAGNVFDWSPLPMLLASLFSLLNQRFNLDLNRCFKVFLIGFGVTFGLFFFAPPNSSLFFLIPGWVFAVSLAVVQYSRKFDLGAVTLFLSMPSFAVCLTAIYLNMPELALFTGYLATAILLISFEISKGQLGPSSSILALKKQLGVIEENFTNLFSMLPDPAVIVDSKGTFLAISASVATITGYKKEELLGNNFVTTDLITSHSKVVLVKNLAKRMLGLHIEPYEIELKLKNGKTLQFELNALKIEYQGRPADMVIFRDLTERNRLLEFSNLLFEFAPDPFYISDLRGNFIDGNKASQDLLEYEKKELIGKNFLKLNLIQNRQIPKAAKLLALNRLGKRTGPDEFQLNRKNGDQVTVEISTYPLKTKEQTVVLGIARDITERKKAEKAIKESEEKFRTIFEKANDGLILLNLDGQVIDLNPRGETIFGLFRENVIGKPYTKLGLTNSIQLNVNNSKLIQDELTPLVETTITRTDGETKHLEVTASSITQNEAPSKTLLTVRDVTERKKLQTSLISSERLAAVGRLATIIAHDLRNPLQGISAAVYVIKRTTQQTRDEKTISALESISDAVKYSDKIIRDLLDYSGDITLDIIETEPQAIITYAMSGITVPNRIKVIDRTQNNPKVYIDLDRIKCVIVNLMTNAFEAMPKGGTLTIVSKERNSGLELSFADTGTGIPKGKKDRLWTPFVTTKAKGIGLGLPICKRIVEAHGGQILVDSETGKGTTITLVLPTKATEKNNIEFLVHERASCKELFENYESLESSFRLQEKEAGGIK